MIDGEQTRPLTGVITQLRALAQQSRKVIDIPPRAHQRRARRDPCGM